MKSKIFYISLRITSEGVKTIPKCLVAKYFYVALQHSPPQDIESIQHDLRNKLYYTYSLLENARTTEVLKVYNLHYAQTGAFPTDKDLVFIPKGLTPAFVQTERKISSKDLYDQFWATDAYGLIGVQFLALFHVFMGGESYLSRNVMSELFHNLSMQALSIEDDSTEIQFIHLTALCRSIGNLLRNNLALIPHKKPPIYLKYTPPRFTPYKNKNQMLEEELVKNKLSKKKLRYRRDSGYMSCPNTPEEV